MKKKLISLAIAGALATPLAVSAQGTNVTLFGTAQAEYNTVDIDGVSSQSNVGDDAGRSRWGMHVTEQLGSGLRAMAHIEYGLNMGSGNIGIARERWVGLGNDAWGDVKFGRVASPFKDFAGGMTIDPFAYTTLQAGGSGGTMVASSNGMGAGANGFVNSAARYDSPVVEGFAFSALLMPGDSNRLDPVTGAVRAPSSGGGFSSGGEDGEWDFQIAAKHSSEFGAHGFDVFGGYSRDNVSTNEKNYVAIRNGNSNDEEIWRGGASWTYEAFRLSGQYENINNASMTGAASCTSSGMLGNSGPATGGTGQCNTSMNIGADGEVWFAGAEYKIGNTRLIAQGGKSHARKGGIDPLTLGAGQGRDAWSYTAGVIHELSKRSSLFGGFQRVDVQDNAATADRDRNTYTVGMRHNF